MKNKSSVTIVQYLIITLLCGGTIFGNTQDSTKSRELQDSSFILPQITPPDMSLARDTILRKPKTHPLKKIVGLSAVLPGAGQMRTGKITRGAMFMSAEIIFPLFIWDRSKTVKLYHNRLDSIQSLITTYRDSLDYYGKQGNIIKYQESFYQMQNSKVEYNLYEYDRHLARLSVAHLSSWAVGIYLWNLADATHQTKQFYNDNSRSPRKAALLSAIPVLGLGQMYNGSYAKAGFIWTFQGALGIISMNYSRMMGKCVREKREVQAIPPTHIDEASRSLHIAGWENRYNEARQRRNQFLWYFTLLYAYGIFDATVDAHLHDSRVKMQLNPIIETTSRDVGVDVSLNIEF